MGLIEQLWERKRTYWQNECSYENCNEIPKHNKVNSQTVALKHSSRLDIQVTHSVNSRIHLRDLFLTSFIFSVLLTPPRLGFSRSVNSSALSLSIAKASVTLEVELLFISLNGLDGLVALECELVDST
jgi:hypothetical protein